MMVQDTFGVSMPAKVAMDQAVRSAPELLFDVVVVPLCLGVQPAMRLAIVRGLIFVIIMAVAVVVTDSCHGDGVLLNEGAGISAWSIVFSHSL